MAGEELEARTAIDRIERRLRTSLPAEYRSYLLSGLPWDDRRRFVRWRAGDQWPSVVEVDRPYHYIARRIPYKQGFTQNPTIEFMLDVFDKRRPGDGVIPPEAIAIASCPTYEELLLFVKGPRYGQVWLKDWLALEEEARDQPELGLHFVASCFSEFLQMLIEEPDNKKN